MAVISFLQELSIGQQIGTAAAIVGSYTLIIQNVRDVLLTVWLL